MRRIEAGEHFTVTLAELAYGFHTEDPLRNAAREQRYHWISNAFEPIPFGMGAARIYGRCAPMFAHVAETRNRAGSTCWSPRWRSISEFR